MNFGGQLLTNLAGFVIPGYYSLETLFSASNTDNTQWLTVSSIAISIVLANSITQIVLGFVCFSNVSLQDFNSPLLI